MKIGSHVSFSKTGLLNAAEEAVGYGATSLMIYTGAPQNTKRKPMEEQHVPEGLKLLNENGIDDFVVHAPYIINLASYKKNIFQLAVDFLQNEIKRTAFVGVKNIVLHPGAFTDKDPEYGIERIAEGLNEVLSQNEDVNIALETMAGKGSEIGRTFEELAAIIDKVKNNDRLTVCFDTCHTHDAGYDIIDDFDGVMAKFDRTVGLDRLAVFHINDSKNFRGAAKDRHAPVGAGLIGFDALHRIVNHEVAKDKPIILETPWIGKDKGDQRPMYEAEIALLSGNAEKRFGAEYHEDVDRIRHLLKGEGIAEDAGARQFIHATWESLRDKNKKTDDKREPMERLYDIVTENKLFPDYNEEQVNHRLVGYFASNA